VLFLRLNAKNKRVQTAEFKARFRKIISVLRKIFPIGFSVNFLCSILSMFGLLVTTREGMLAVASVHYLVSVVELGLISQVFFPWLLGPVIKDLEIMVSTNAGPRSDQKDALRRLRDGIVYMLLMTRVLGGFTIIPTTLFGSWPFLQVGQI
jgi:hypothetical protein